MAEVHLSSGEQVTVKCCCPTSEPSGVTIKSADGVYPIVDLFEASDGMQIHPVGFKKNHDDEYPITSFLPAYMGETDDGFRCLIAQEEFPDRKVRVRPDHGSGSPAEVPQEFTILDFRGDNLYIYLDDVLAGFTAAQLKAAMTPAMRTALAAILP